MSEKKSVHYGYCTFIGLSLVNDCPACGAESPYMQASDTGVMTCQKCGTRVSEAGAFTPVKTVMDVDNHGNRKK